ncbi:hypothetical protein D3C73_1466630 [compost metagenome]
MLLISKRLHNTDAADIIFDTGVIICNISKHPFESMRHFPAEVYGQINHQRHNNEGQNRQLPINAQHNTKYSEQCHHRNE